MKDLFSITAEAAVLNGRHEDARYTLFEQHIAKTVTIAITLQRRLPDGILFDEQDFVMIGLQTLWKITERYVPSMNNSFWTFARPRIAGSMIDEIRDSDPVSRSNRDMLKKIERRRQKFEQESGQEATFEKACSLLGIDGEKQSELEEITSTHFVSIDASAHSTGDGGSEIGPIEEIIADPNGIDPIALADRQDEVASLEKLLNQLEPMERSLIRLYFYSGLRLNDVASALGVTESRICQRLSQVLEKLRGLAKNDGVVFPDQITWE